MSTETITELNPQPEIDETLRKWLADYIAAHPEHTTAVLARADYIGMSRRALDSLSERALLSSTREGRRGRRPGELPPGAGHPRLSVACAESGPAWQSWNVCRNRNMEISTARLRHGH